VRSGLIAVALVVSTVTSGTAVAQHGGAIDMQLFRPAVDSKGYITVDGPETVGHLQLSVGVNVNYAYKPLSLRAPTTVSTWCVDQVACSAGDENYLYSRYRINHLATGNLVAALGLSKYFQLGIGVPMTFWMGSTTPTAQQLIGVNEDTISAFGIGDLALHLKGRVLKQPKFPLGLGIRLTVAFPTAKPDSFLGSGRVRITPVVLVERTLLKGRLRFALNVGAHLRFGEERFWTDSRLCDPMDGTAAVDCGTGRQMSTGHHLFYGLGIGFTVLKNRLDVLAEFVGQTPFDGFYDLSEEGALGSGHEAIIGIRLRMVGQTYFEAGAAFGLFRTEDNFQYGTPLARAYFGLVVQSTLTGAMKMAGKVGQWGPVKATIDAFKEKAKEKLDKYLASVKARIQKLAQELADKAIAKGMQLIFNEDTDKLVRKVIAGYDKWQAIQAQLMVVYTTSGRELAKAKAKLKSMLAKAQSVAGDLQNTLRALVEQRVRETIRPRFEMLLNTQWDKVVTPILDKGANALTSLTASVPGAGGILSVTVNLLIAKAKVTLRTWALAKAMTLLDSLLDKTFKKIWGVVFKAGGKVEGALKWVNSKLKELNAAIDKASSEIESRRQLLLRVLR
jgi:hypothetical protein